MKLTTPVADLLSSGGLASLTTLYGNIPEVMRWERAFPGDSTVNCFQSWELLNPYPDDIFTNWYHRCKGPTVRPGQMPDVWIIPV